MDGPFRALAVVQLATSVGTQRHHFIEDPSRERTYVATVCHQGERRLISVCLLHYGPAVAAPPLFGTCNTIVSNRRGKSRNHFKQPPK